MPHMIIEYSANLDARVDMAGLCDTMRRAMLDTGLFEVGAVRVRAIRCEAYSVADALAENAFVAMTLKLAPGRAAEARKGAGDLIFKAAQGALAPLFETPHFALSFDMQELDAEFGWKRNAMHPRLRGK
jgi:5-carboxymethyl-2-hydroxymuconate isomerase